jgi:putative tryptophan/tyrosine transport system substrate-binding protein
MWPLPAHAQTPDRLRRLGVLMGTADNDPLGQSRISAFRQELQEQGWKEGRNLKIELRWSGGDASRIKDYTAELVRLAPDVIVANGSLLVAAMEQATRSIPIVFVVVNDPSQLRCVRGQRAVGPR